MASVNLESAVQIVAIVGGSIALLAASFQVVDTFLDINEKLYKRRFRRKESNPDTTTTTISETNPTRPKR